jgi:hypothetical protein
MIPEGNSHGWEGGFQLWRSGRTGKPLNLKGFLPASTQGFPASLGGFKPYYSKIFTLPYIVDCLLLEKFVFRLKYCLFSVKSTVEEDVFAMLIGGP